jgi:hypothetical protein
MSMSIKTVGVMVAVVIAALVTAGITATGLTSSVFAQEQKFMATLSGQEEVPPTNSQATGVAEFIPGEDSVVYSVNATNIQGVTAGHVHLGKPGENGPIVITLFKYDTPMNQVSEIGSFTAADQEGPMAGQPFEELGTAAINGSLYVNIHTETNPNGEIRGQVTSSSSGATMAQ